MKQYSKSKSDVLIFPLEGHKVTDKSGTLIVSQGTKTVMPIKIGGMICRVYEGRLYIVPESLTRRSDIVLTFEPTLKPGTEPIFCDRIDNSKQKKVNFENEVATTEIGYDRGEGFFISYEYDIKKIHEVKTKQPTEPENITNYTACVEGQMQDVMPITGDGGEVNTERIGERITMLKNTVSVYRASTGDKADESLDKVFELITEAESILATYIATRQNKTEKDTVIE